MTELQIVVLFVFQILFYKFLWQIMWVEDLKLHFRTFQLRISFAKLHLQI